MAKPKIKTSRKIDALLERIGRFLAAGDEAVVDELTAISCLSLNEGVLEDERVDADWAGDIFEAGVSVGRLRRPVWSSYADVERTLYFFDGTEAQVVKRLKKILDKPSRRGQNPPKADAGDGGGDYDEDGGKRRRRARGGLAGAVMRLTR